VAQTGEPLIIDDYRTWGGRAAVYEEGQPFRAVLAVPMIWQDKVTGVIDILHYMEGRAFSEDDLKLLSLFANHAAIAVENTRLYEQAQDEIAERKRLEKQIEKRRRYLEGVLACAPDAIITLDGQHRVQEWNQGAERLFGFPREEALGRNVDDMIAVADDKAFSEARGYTSRVLSGESLPPTETVRYRKGGTPVDVIVAGAPIVVEDEVVGVVGVYTDITRQKDAEEEIRRQANELEQAVARLKELDLLKSEFMQNVSHELRTPLSLVGGYAGLLASGDLGELTPEQREPLDSIVRQTQTLKTLVEDITLILSMDIRAPAREPVMVDELVRSAVGDFQLAAEEAQLALTAEIGPGLPPVNAAPVYLRRVLENLLDNAIKFTPAGGTVSVRLWQRDDRLVLEVSDSGIGIAPGEQKRVFERFYQVDGTVRRKRGGTGLGLALVKEIIEAYGGAVGVQSELGQGSRFTVMLPVVQGWPTSES
jgi:PAS domain S-box-containing protein